MFAFVRGADDQRKSQGLCLVKFLWEAKAEVSRINYGEQEYTMGKDYSLQQIVLGKLDIHKQKNETEPLHKNQLKIN